MFHNDVNINRLIDESSNTNTEPEQCVSPPHSPSPAVPRSEETSPRRGRLSNVSMAKRT